MVIKDPRTRDFTSGLIAAMVSVTSVYPITKLIYRQILEKALFKDSFGRMKKEGIRYMYRGLFPPLVQRSSEISMMFGVFQTAELALHPFKLCVYHEKIASSTIAGLVESILTPCERTQLLLINSKYNGQFKNWGHVVLVLFKEYSPKEFYRGYTAILLRNICNNVFFFLTKDALNALVKRHDNRGKNLGNFFVGASAGLSMTALFFPIKVIKANMQRPLGGKFKSFFEVAGEVYKYKGQGIRNFYVGLHLNLIGAMLGWGITNLGFEFLRARI